MKKSSGEETCEDVVAKVWVRRTTNAESAAEKTSRIISLIFGSSPSEPVLEVIEKVKRRYAEATAALDACDREHRLSSGRRPTFLVYRVICTDEDALHWREEDIGNLRVALNALMRVFRLR